MATVMTRLGARVAIAVLGAGIALTMAGCDGSTSEPTPDRTTASSPAPSAGASSTQGTPGSGSSVAVNDSAIVDGLRAQGYQCDDRVRCERVKSQVTEVIELGAGRAVFVVTATDGSPELSSALSSVLDDYGSVLPQRTFAGLEWDQFTAWVAEHPGDETAERTIADWRATLRSDGPRTRKLILTLP